MTTPEPDGNATRVAVAGDWHGNTRWALATIRAIPADITLLIHLGDFGYMGEGFPTYLHKVSREAQRRGLTIHVVPGNHENYDWLARQPLDSAGRSITAPHVLALPRGYRFSIGQRTAIAVGGAVSVDQGRRTPGKTWWPQEELTDDEAAAIASGEPVDIMFTHDMPLGSGCPGLDHRQLVEWAGERVASAAYLHHRRIRDITEALTPRHLIHGHMHARYTNTVTWTSTHETPFTCTIDGLACDTMPGNLTILTVSPTGIALADVQVKQR